MSDRTSDRDPIDALLEQAGSASTPTPDPMFVARLEADLRIAHVAAGARVGPASATRRGFWLVGGGALLGAAAVVVLFVLFSGSSRTAVDLDQGVAGQPNTPVVTEPPRPDPARPDPPDRDDDVADIDDESVVADDAYTGTPSTSAPDAADSTAAGSDGDRPVSGPSTTRPADDPAPSSSTTQPDVTPTTTTTTAPVTTTTTATPPSDTRPPVERLDLSARHVDAGTVAVAWSAYDGDDFAVWRVFRRNTDGTDAAVIHTSRTRDERRMSDQPQDRDVAYRVVALDSEGRVVAESGWVRLARRTPERVDDEATADDPPAEAREASTSEPAAGEPEGETSP